MSVASSSSKQKRKKVESQTWQDISTIPHLRGPISLTHMKKSDQVSIYLFGDRHYRSKADCDCVIDITEYFDLWFKTVPVTTDFIMETTDLTGMTLDREHASYLTDLRKHFQSCFHLNKDKSVCTSTYPLVRFHMNDFRLTLKGLPSYEDLNTCIIYYSIIYKISTTLNKCTLPQRNILQDYLDKKTIEVHSEYIKALHNYKNLLAQCSEALKETLQDLITSHTYLFKARFSSIFMDVYTIARIVRPWKQKDMFKNVIVFTGDAHTEEYIHILRRLDFQIITTTKHKEQVAAEEKCIDTKQCPSNYSCIEERCRKEVICDTLGQDGKDQCIDMRRFYPLQFINT